MEILKKVSWILLTLLFPAFHLQGVSAQHSSYLPLAQSIQPPADWPEHVEDKFENNINSWPLGIEENEWVKNEWDISDGTYRWQARANSDFFWYVYPDTSEVADFFLSVDLLQDKGLTDAMGGVAFRISQDGFYIFGISNTGEYSVYCSYQEEWYTLIDWTYSPAIFPNQINHISILAHRDSFQFAVNDQFLAEIIDDRLTSGNVGLMIGLYKEGDQAVINFDNYLLHAPVDANFLSREASDLSDQGKYEASIQKYNQSLALYREVNDEASIAQTLNNIGWMRSKLSDYQGAIQTFEESIATFRQLGDKAGEAKVLKNIALVTANSIGYHKGYEILQQQLKIVQDTSDVGEEAETLNELGKFCIIIGEYEQALQYFQKASEIWRQLGDSLNLSRAVNNIGVIYSYLGDDERALEHYKQSLQIAMEIDDPWREAIWRSNIGEVYLNFGDLKQALEYFLQAKAIYDEVQDPRRQYDANTLAGIGLVHKKMGDFTQALTILQEALEIMREVNEPHGEASILLDLGELYYETENYPLALVALNDALHLYRQTGDPHGETGTLGLIGKVQEAQGSPESALQSYLEAVQVRESILGQLKAEAFQATLAAQGSEVYQRAVRLLVEADDAEQAFNLSERNRARAFLDSLGNKRPELRQGADAELLHQEAELRDEITTLENSLFIEKSKPAGQRSEQAVANIEAILATRQKAYEDLLANIQISSPEAASLVSVPTMTVSDAQLALNGDTTLLAYYLTNSNSLAFLITSKEFQVVTLPAKPQEITEAVEAFRALGLSNLADPHPRSLNNLYKWLITPVLPFLRTSVVGIVPHQALHYVPFSALDDGTTYLGEQYILFQLPSASALPFLHAKSGRPIDYVLVLGNPRSDNSALPSLAYAEEEAKQVAELFKGQALIGDHASEMALRLQSSEAGYVHLAAHGTLNPVAPQFSRLWLTPGGDEDGRLNLYEVYSLDLINTDLVVLSACQTQLGMLSAGDEVTSLNRAFLYSVPTVVSSLWSVDDAATGALMERFYSHIREGNGKAEALRQAQADLRQDAQHPEWNHPYYWAAFVLNGDPGHISNLGSSTTNRMLPLFVAGAFLLGVLGIVAFRYKQRKQ